MTPSRTLTATGIAAVLALSAGACTSRAVPAAMGPGGGGPVVVQGTAQSAKSLGLVVSPINPALDKPSSGVASTGSDTGSGAPSGTAASSSPHFATPEAAMSYLVHAWNTNNVTDLDHVTTPSAQAALASMHDEAQNLRLDHCTVRPQGDYLCYFNHDYPPSTPTTNPDGIGHAVFVVAPADAPGWYMTVLQNCG